jgi:hypothetical protein
MVRGKVMTDSSKAELEKLKKQRAELESKLVAVQKNRNTLEDETGVLEETVAIRELVEKLKEEEDAVAKLTLKREELRNRSKAPKESATPKAAQKMKEEVEDKPETAEQTRVIWKRDEQTPISWKRDEETPENAKPQEDESKESEEKQEKKKKLKFF